MIQDCGNSLTLKGYFIFKTFILTIILFLSSCTHISKEGIIHSLKSQFGSSSYSTVQNTPGTSYIEKDVNQTSFRMNESGNFLLSPGDYSIPVMTYCMNSSSSSPAGHAYTLSRIEGKLAPIIRKINLKAPSQFPTSDIQIAHWSLLSGLSYKEMTEESQKIIDQIIPEHRADLKESFLSTMERKLDHLYDMSNGTIPTLSQIPYLEEMRSFRDKLREVGNDYKELKSFIDTTPRNKNGSQTPWSKISENIYARFVTEGSFGDIGFLQISVFPETGRTINSESQKKYPLDVTSLIANPNDPSVQPLSFTPLYGMAGVVATSRIATNPRATALLIALTLAVYPMNWDDFFKLEELLEDVRDKKIQKEIDNGKEILRKEHDELEKPLKEAGIISGKDKNHSKEKEETREYRNPGGTEQLQKDFDKISGELSKAGDSTEIKTLPDGTTIVKSPGSNNGPTLEIQPPKNNAKYPDSRIRVKVRYK